MPAYLLHLLQPLNIKKEAFLPAFKAAFKRLITKENIYAGFRGARLVLHNLEAVILKLDLTLVCKRVQLHRDSLVSPLLRAVKQLNKGIAQIGHDSAVESLIVGEVANLIAKREGSRQQGGREPAKKVRTQRRCGRCRETGYNARTCAVEIVDASNSNKSK
ncbi:uncharacterized protein M421DRAFT_426500 [Didymella exigua CBS 183.55]|uniref:Uncharacterized protein n=1 Tax=Didymella exigua CBS 183.55 TaxID=1150837 RepID=A0A6A5R664_9PLEO|nr:uncharacterized protein M421DRAFT_426500 [Didymella exigua CBS 183.55]KAF1922879.1 hypothetical protein M421DRAFT_426500 [Didymella exigua CBS 183.55]